MLTLAALNRRLDVLKDPLSLCGQLDLHPTPRQSEVLKALATNPGFYQVVGDDRHEMERAAAVYALWRILASPSSRGIMLASTQGQAGKIMGFLSQVTQNVSTALASVSGFPHWNVLRIGGQPSWELQMMPNKAPVVAQRAPNAILSVVFGDRSSDPDFREAVSALEATSTHQKHTRIVVW